MTVLGAINWDVTLFEDRFPDPGEEVPVRSIEEGPGGKGANVAVASARILGPGRVSLVGAVGDDLASAELTRGLSSEGVDCRGVRVVRGSETGVAHVVVDSSGKKVIHTSFGANDLLGGLGPAARRAVSEAEVLVVMDVPAGTAERAVRLARPGATVVYSPGVRVSRGAGGLEETLGEVSLLVLDSPELGHIKAELKGRGFFDSNPDLTVIETLGSRGARSVTPAGETFHPGVDLVHLGLSPRNSAGAGDAFLGALACSLLDGRPLDEAIAAANLAGALKTSKSESRGSPTRRELQAAEKKLRKLRRWPLA